MRNVRDVHAENKPVFRALYADRVVKVARVLAVYGNGQNISEISSAREGHLFRANFARLGKRLLRKIFREGIGLDERVLFGGKIAALAEHFRDLTFRPPAFGPCGDLYEHLFARKRTLSAADDTDLVVIFFIVRQDAAAPLLSVISTRQLFYPAGKNAVYFRLVAAFAAEDPGKHRVFMLCAVQRAVRDKEIVFAFADEKGKAPLVPAQNSFDERKLFGRNEPAALVAHDIARLQ